jgi:hypothetical protein
MMDYQELLYAFCPIEIAEHIRNIDLNTSGSVFWPPNYEQPYPFPDDCMAAMIGAVGEHLDPSVDGEILGSYFQKAWISNSALPPETVAQVAALAGRVTITEDLFLDYFRALRSLKIDVRDQIADQFIEQPMEGNWFRYSRYYQYQLYRAVFAEPGVMDWFQALTDRLLDPDQILGVMDDLEHEKVPGWQDFVRQFIDDDRRSIGIDGCGGLTLASNARVLLEMFPVVPRKGVIVYVPDEDGRPQPPCAPDR